MNELRPKNLNLFTISFPLPAIVSILHRMSGAVLFVIAPFALWVLDVSLTEQGFDLLQQWLASPGVKFLLWLVLVPFCFHLVSGIRHLLMDMHIGQSLKAGRMAAMLTFALSFVLIVLAGVWLW